MKKYVLLLILSLMQFAIYAQDKTDFIYLFDDFQKGTITYKSGSTADALFNYELIIETIHFKDANSEALELAQPETIKYIKFGDNTFEHIKSSTFYQKIDLGNIDLYIKHGGSLLPKGQDVGYGSSQTASINNITRIDRGKDPHTNVGSNEKYEVGKKTVFYIKINGKFKHFHSAGSLAKLFKEHETEIKEAIKDENTNFRKIEDVIEAVRFCGELMEK